MWGIGIVFAIIVFVIILLLVTSKTGKKEEKVEKRVYAMPPQKRYPYFYFKDCKYILKLRDLKKFENKKNCQTQFCLTILNKIIKFSTII